MSIVAPLLVLGNLPAWQERLHSAAFVQPPWHQLHPQRQQIENDLPADLMRLARLIDRLVDRLSLQGLLASYRHKGSKPLRPDLMLKAVLFLTQRGHHSPADWDNKAWENRVVGWLLRGTHPSRAAWYAFRQRLIPFIDDLNRQLLALARSEELLRGEVPVLDGTLLAANSSRHTLVNHDTLQRRLEHLQQAIESDEAIDSDEAAAAASAALARTEGPAAAGPPTPQQADPSAATQSLCSAERPAAQEAQPGSSPQPPAALPAAPTTEPRVAQPGVAPAASTTLPAGADSAGSVKEPAWMAPTPRGRQGQQQRYLQAQKELELRLLHNAKRRKEDRKAPEKVKISLGDPQATLGLDKEKVYRPLYNVQVACDLYTDFYLSYGIFSGVQDGATYAAMLERTEYFTGHKVERALVDAGYVSGANLRESEKRQVELIGPYQENDYSKGKRKDKQIPKSEFIWEEDKQRYVCPEGQALEYLRTQKRQRGEVLEEHRQYRCAPLHCQSCPRQADCTPKPKAGRMVVRGEYEEEVQRHKAKMGREDSKQVYKKRKEQIERRYADQKEHRKLRKLSMRGREGGRVQVGLTVLASNMVLFEKLHSQRQQTTPAPR